MPVEPVELKTERSESAEQAVEYLADALEQARAGSVAAVGIAIVRPDGHVNVTFTDFDNAGRLLGAIAVLQARAIAGMAIR